VMGHPFHPAPKGADSGLEPFRPEHGASFPLVYLAVEPRLVRGLLGKGVAEPTPDDVRREAAERLGGKPWALLPCHPWQLAALRRHPAVAALIDDRRLVPLGPLGEPAAPTSSVRTVYLRRSDRFVKLPLDTRITNFVRTNPIDQLERAMDVAAVVAALPPSATGPHLHILPEQGYRFIHDPEWPQTVADQVVPSCAVLYRGGIAALPGPAPVVVAALLEPGPGDEPPLSGVLWQSARSHGRPLTAAWAARWFARYLEVAVLPVLGLFARHGLGLEAHVQNMLVGLDQGWPVYAVARDLEGATLDRDRFGGALPVGSPALADPDEAWKRLQYYLVVNHLMHLAATLAACSRAEEWQLWEVARHTVAAAAPPVGDRTRRWYDALLASHALPAKANLVSRFEGRGERPKYVSVPNPLRPRCAGNGDTRSEP
jgi:L-2,3-diaminopropanoate---citrate ligase